MLRCDRSCRLAWLIDTGLQGGYDRVNTNQIGANMNIKTPKQLPNRAPKLAKNDSRYWASRITKPVNDRGEKSPHYFMQLQFKGRRLSFGLRTGNKDAAAKKAQVIYSDLLSLGVEGTIAKERPPKEEKPPQTATVGEWIDEAQKVFDGRPATFGGYSRALRSIVADIRNVSKTKARFARGDEDAYRREIDAAPLDILTVDAIQAWRIGFVSKAARNPSKQRTARISANSIMRQAKALFSKKLLKFLSGVIVPKPLPFNGCDFYPRENMRYSSKIDLAELLPAAISGLQESDPDAFKAFLLALGAGLRRGEIDKLLWRQVDFDAGVLHIEATEAGDLKTSDSTGDVPIDETIVGFLRGFRAKSKGPFVLDGNEGETESREWGQRYRCDDVFSRLNTWLRANGVDTSKPIHTLRKEAGSIIATKSGIHAASIFLRHSDIQVTAMHYADHKERVTVALGAFLTPGNVTKMPTPLADNTDKTEKPRTKTKRHAKKA